MATDEKRTVGDYVTLTRGTTYKGALVGHPGPALLGLGSIEPGGGFRQSDFKTYGGDCPPGLMLASGDLYAALKGATKDGKMIGSVARVPTSVPSGRITQDTVKLVFRESSEDEAKFLYWMLRTPQYRDYCAGRAMGSAVVALSRTDFLSYPIPELTAARRHLVALFESIDDRIALLRDTNRTLEDMARLLFGAWFVDFEPVRAKMEGRAPTSCDAATAALFPDRLVESELGEIPEGWEVVSAGDVAEIIKGKSYKSDELQASRVALVTLKSFERGGGFRMDGFKGYVGKYKAEQVIVPGECVVAYTDVTQQAEVIGRAALVLPSPEHDTLVASLDVGIVRPRREGISPGFLYPVSYTHLTLPTKRIV